MAFTSIGSSLVTAGKAVTQTLTNLIKNNFDDHEARIVALEAATIVNGFIVGEIRVWPAAALPSGFLYCDGSAVSRTVDYDDLFAVIGTTFGIGDGTTTFNVPDLRGRVPVGKDDMNNAVGTGGGAASRMTSGGSGVNGASLGAVGGTETHTLTTGQLATHTHTINDSGHVHSVTDAGHVHSINEIGTGGGGLNYLSRSGTNATSVTPQTGCIANSTTGISIVSATTGITASNNGSGTAHNNTQPSLICNYVIRYLAN